MTEWAVPRGQEYREMDYASNSIMSLVPEFGRGSQVPSTIPGVVLGQVPWVLGLRRKTLQP